jgi:hypothetical protein
LILIQFADESFADDGKNPIECHSPRSCIFVRNVIDHRSKDSTPPGSPGYSKEFCKALVDKMCVDSSLPSECIQFPNIMSDVQRRNSDRSNQAIAFQGMSAREQAAAMSNRDKGQLHHAQVQRRLTTTRRSFKK